MSVRPRRASALLIAALVVFGTALPAAAQDASRWFLAEGASNAVLEQEILVANPGTSTLTVTVTLLPDASAIVTGPIEKAYTLNASSRLTIRVASEFPGLNGAASARVSAVVAGSSTPADIVVERSMYFPDGTRAGGHNASGVTQARQRWILAEGASGVFSTFILVANPNASTTPIRVRYLKSTGDVVEFEQTLPANSRTTFWPQNDFPAQLASAEFSTVVESLDNDEPIVAERAMYFDPSPTGSGFARSGHDALGVPEASETWYFAEGFTGGNAQTAFETFLLLANTNPSATTATVTYQLDSGETVERDYPLAANQRLTIWVDQEGRNFDARLTASSFGITVTATQPIVAERAMYWGTPSSADPTTPTFPWREGHATAGSPVLAPRWAFAEGREGVDAQGRPYATFFLLSNPSNAPINVTATFVTEDGGGITSTAVIPAKGRVNIWPTAGLPEFAALANRRFATFIESPGAEPFVAERAMYLFADFSSGHVNMGTPWTGTIAPPPRAPVAVSTSGFTPGVMRLRGGELLTISGANFSGLVEVTVDGIAGTVTEVTPTQIKALAPLRTSTTGFGTTAPSTIRLTASGQTVTVGAIGRQFRVMAIGDSFTEGLLVELLPTTPPTYDDDPAAPPYPQRLRELLRGDSRLGSDVIVSNEGRSGECASVAGCSSNPTSGLGRMGDLVARTAWDAVIIMEGFNDLNDGRQNAGSIVAALREMGRAVASTGALPIVGILEGPMDSLAGGIVTMAMQEGFARHSFRGIELGNDDVHPSQAGYNAMAQQAYDKLKALFP